ncbi:MAG TPA: hypothetical protein VEH75_03520 [Xanthobacteraceae bacterium]|nr:hypothetical protein [Xanthobacteraceae bacterium]
MQQERGRRAKAEPLERGEHLRKRILAAGKRFLQLRLAPVEGRETLFRLAELGLGRANARGGVEKVLREFLAIALDLVDLALEFGFLLARALQVA